MSVCMCVSVERSLTTTSRPHWQGEVNKIDGVDSYYEFIVPAESIENKYIHRNDEAREQNEYLTFHIPLVRSVCVCASFLSVSGVGTAAGYMKTIHHCIFTVKLLTERRTRSYIGYILRAWTKRKVTHL